MEIVTAQQQVRSIFAGGAAGQFVSGVIWTIAAVLATWSTHGRAMTFITLGGMFIYPFTQLTLRILGRPASLPPANPMRFLAMQIAFTIPLSLPVVFAAAAHRPSWFFPALLMIVGCHYLPFIFLYGMWQFGALAGAMISGGLWLGLTPDAPFAAGAWMGAAMLLAFVPVGTLVSKNVKSMG